MDFITAPIEVLEIGAKMDSEIKLRKQTQTEQMADGAILVHKLTRVNL